VILFVLFHRGVTPAWFIRPRWGLYQSIQWCNSPQGKYISAGGTAPGQIIRKKSYYPERVK